MYLNLRVLNNNISNMEILARRISLERCKSFLMPHFDNIRQLVTIVS